MFVVPDEDAALARGLRATVLVESPAYTEVMQDLENLHITALVSCPPGPEWAAAREHHHLTLHALREIAEQLAGYVEAGREITARRHSDLDEDLDVD